jgi:hypothetical protein
MYKVYFNYDSNGKKYVTVICTADEELKANQQKEKYTK